MTLTRTYRLDELEYLPCSCPVCRKYSVEELREMPKDERVKLLALHNLHVLRQAINEVKQAIREGRLWELLEEKSRIHPSLARMLTVIKRYSDKLEKLTPRVKGGFVKGVFLYGPESMYNPKIRAHHRNILERFKPRLEGARLILVPVNTDEKPFTHTEAYRKARRETENAHVVGYILYLGVIPEELAETYPLSQFEVNTEPYHEVVEETANKIVEYVRRNVNVYSGIVVWACREWEWSMKLAEAVKEKLGVAGIGKPIEVRIVACS
jgi:7-cyano-7-deazaguanine tRNA-ribosyltransferase